MKILLIENDKKLNYAICEYLTCKDFKVVTSYHGDIVYSEDLKKYDLFIISNNTQDTSGLELLKYIKDKSKNNKVIFLNENEDVLELEKAFYYNCDDYIKKPFLLKELELRILRSLGVSHLINIHNDLMFNIKTSNLYYKGSEVVLRKKEKNLLNILVKKRGSTVTKDEIIKSVWSNSDFDEYPIRQLISNLREKLPANIIETKTGKGYQIS